MWSTFINQPKKTQSRALHKPSIFQPKNCAITESGCELQNRIYIKTFKLKFILKNCFKVKIVSRFCKKRKKKKKKSFASRRFDCRYNYQVVLTYIILIFTSYFPGQIFPRYRCWGDSTSAFSHFYNTHLIILLLTQSFTNTSTLSLFFTALQKGLHIYNNVAFTRTDIPLPPRWILHCYQAELSEFLWDCVGNHGPQVRLLFTSS